MPQPYPHVVSWFEIPANDFDRAVAFYETILNITLLHEIRDSNQLGIFPFEPGEISGCIITGARYRPSEYGSVVYLKAQPDLVTVLNRVDDAGGLVTVPATPLPADRGFFAQIIDTEGNRVGLFAYQ